MSGCHLCVHVAPCRLIFFCNTLKFWETCFYIIYMNTYLVVIISIVHLIPIFVFFHIYVNNFRSISIRNFKFLHPCEPKWYAYAQTVYVSHEYFTSASPVCSCILMFSHSCLLLLNYYTVVTSSMSINPEI